MTGHKPSDSEVSFYSEIGKFKLLGCVWRDQKTYLRFVEDLYLYAHKKQLFFFITPPTFKEFAKSEVCS